MDSAKKAAAIIAVAAACGPINPGVKPCAPEPAKPKEPHANRKTKRGSAKQYFKTIYK